MRTDAGIFEPAKRTGLEALVRYMMRPPVSLARLRLLPSSDEVLHFPKAGGDDPVSAKPERIDAMDYVARVLAQIPPPRKHLVRYHGFYSNAARGKRRRDRSGPVGSVSPEQEPAPTPEAAALRKRWADLLRRVYEIDPLVCPRCSATMRALGIHHTAPDHQAHPRSSAAFHFTPEVPACTRDSDARGLLPMPAWLTATTTLGVRPCVDRYCHLGSGA